MHAKALSLLYVDQLLEDMKQVKFQDELLLITLDACRRRCPCCSCQQLLEDVTQVNFKEIGTLRK